jgi:hypothetical protein
MKRVRLVIVSQICETMIRMSRSRSAALLLTLAFSGALAGCCGGAHSHKCDFASLDSQKDGASDGPVMCGTLTCDPPTTVCCLQKVAPYYSCVPLADFDLHQCEKPPDVAPECVVPKDCDSGKVCCLQYAAVPPALNCQPTCQGASNYQACATDLDCPTQLPGSCGIIAGGPDAGYSVSVCPPQP